MTPGKPGCNKRVYGFLFLCLFLGGCAGEQFRGAATSGQSSSQGGAVQGVIAEDDLRLFWGDEFNGIALDRSKWTYWQPGKFFGGYNTPDALYLDGAGHLVIETYGVRPRFENGNSPTETKYYSCGIHTGGKFEHKYGYWEARIKLPSQEGHTCAFWIHSYKVHPENAADGQFAVEKDVMEWFPGVAADGMTQNVHWGGYGDDHQMRVHRVERPGLTEGFHTYGVEWKEDEYVFYVDRQETTRVQAGTRGASNTEEFIVISNAVIADRCGDIEKAILPDYYIVDYVRVYERRP